MIAKRLTNIGFTYLRAKDYPQVLAYANRALGLSVAIDEQRMAAVNLGNLGDAYLQIAKAAYKYKPDSLLPPGREANIAK